MELVRIPAIVAAAVREEQSKNERKIKKVRDEMELIKRELEREQVARRAGKREREERDKENAKRIDELQRYVDNSESACRSH
jgi:Skp family chaperone for outer membrane proteins